MGSLDLTTFTGFLIRRAQQAHMAAWQREVSSDVTSVQFGVLNLLHDSPGSSQKDLCTALDVDRSTIADIVARLQSRALIERVRDTQDRRRNILHLTERGEREWLELIPRVYRVDQVLTDTLEDSDRAELQRLLTLMLQAPKVRKVMRESPHPL
ncbi:MarR family winged helix-turn-helix transcriptional regulator [Microbacterium sp. STN6]|uniref:MarR family winged helix-turn-helix transcriptional regulator n=1 Tax=Microbacterium sp. STN6 TaxID=2995588 RepID=UPI0022610055|nr:MarR family winged helix-turn-helix transcriptional regulator [Microbacterium sp. STN6]MCX7523304.1 MarR family winged helix-turn-helix transcriptional regulator [Microbacterium sp. STN6]